MFVRKNINLFVLKFNSPPQQKQTKWRSFATKPNYKKYSQILGVSEDCDQEELRSVYLELVKKFHPDSGSQNADAAKFQEIDEAFRLLTEKKARERWNVEEEVKVETSIKHKVPQHRQYLSFEGIVSGTPFQRQKQYQQVRAVQAAQNVMEHRVAKATADVNALWNKSAPKQKHDIKTKYGFDRLVEDLIQESMSKGEFNNLPGCGKPLQPKHDRNPFVDLMTQKLNEVLIENGFTPEWISLQKEIREDIERLRSGLAMERSYFGPNPLNGEDSAIWARAVRKYEKLTHNINEKINKYNLVVPILNKQMFHVSLVKEANKILVTGNCSSRTNYPENAKKVKEEPVFGLFSLLFKT